MALVSSGVVMLGKKLLIKTTLYSDGSTCITYYSDGVARVKVGKLDAEAKDTIREHCIWEYKNKFWERLYGILE